MKLGIFRVGKVNLNSYLNLAIYRREKRTGWYIRYICELWEKPAGACFWRVAPTRSIIDVTAQHTPCPCESLEICNDSCVLFFILFSRSPMWLDKTAKASASVFAGHSEMSSWNFSLSEFLEADGQNT